MIAHFPIFSVVVQNFHARKKDTAIGNRFNVHATSFAVEDLHIKGMVKNRKLSRAIHDVGWGKFLTVLAYKCERSSVAILVSAGVTAKGVESMTPRRSQEAPTRAA